MSATEQRAAIRGSVAPFAQVHQPNTYMLSTIDCTGACCLVSAMASPKSMISKCGISLSPIRAARVSPLPAIHAIAC